jgi:LuxR family transcriptional activator of conjugal transfer of Ti plasmids
MDARYDDALSFLREARDFGSLSLLEARFSGMVSRFGFDRTSCVLMAEPGRPINPRILFGVGDPAYRNHYLGAQRFRVDPTFQAVFHKTRAFTWSDVADLAISEDARSLFAGARKDGSEGLVVPVHGAFGEVSAVVMVGRSADVSEQSKAVLQACGAMFAVAGLQLLELSDDSATHTDLTRRETQVLVWLSRGKSIPEIAVILDISIGTVKTHLERAKVKLGVFATVPTVLEAARRGWLLDPDDFD